MVRANRVQIVFVFVFFLGVLVFNQEMQVDENKQLREEILDAYQSGGEKRLRRFVKKKKDKISNKFILDFAKVAIKEKKKEKKEEWLTVCKILAEKKKDKKTLAEVLYNTGIYFVSISDNKKAADYFDQALAIYRKLNNSGGQGKVYDCKGNIYLKKSEYYRALDMFKKALHFFEKAGKPIAQAKVYQCKGKIYSKIGEISNAIKMYNEALEFFEKAGDTVGLANVYLSKGEIYLRIGDNPRALEMFDKAMPYFKEAGQQVGQGNVYLNKGKIYLKKGENSRDLEMYDKALGFYNKAEVFYKKAGDMMSESNALWGKGEVLKQQGKTDKARKLYELGIEKLEQMRTQTAFSDLKITFMETVYQRYQEIVLFMLENKYHDKGFKYAESMKARVFLERVCEGFTDLERGITTEQKEKRKEYVAKLSNLSKDIHKNAGKRDEKKLQELKQQRLELERNLEYLEFKARMDNPNYKRVKYREQVSARDLQTGVLKKGELLLHYFISPNKLYVFIISKESFKVVPIEVKEKEIKHIVNRFLLGLREDYTPSIKKYGKILYHKLFKPLEEDIKNSEYLIIIPDGELSKIPFESFIIDNDKSGRPVFLLGKYRLIYIQSATVLSEMRESIRDRVAKSFIGFGDPVYDYENFRQGKPEQVAPSRSPGKDGEKRERFRSLYTSAGGILSRLPGTGEEIKAIARLFERKNQKYAVYLREQASEDNAKAPGIENFDFIHFACHGNINDDFKGLVLSQLPSDQSSEDGYFILKEIMNWDFDAKLVVFSACRTGTGKIVKGEGIIGLTTTVMCTGTPAVIATLWKVDDTAAKELMVNFYSNMLEKNLDKNEALRQAKLELIKNENYRYPFFWSAFVMYGE